MTELAAVGSGKRGVIAEAALARRLHDRHTGGNLLAREHQTLADKIGVNRVAGLGAKTAHHVILADIKPRVPQVKDDEPCDVEVEKKYGDDFNRFYVTLTGKDEPEDKVLITLSREGFFFWRVTNVLLPFGA